MATFELELSHNELLVIDSPDLMPAAPSQGTMAALASSEKKTARIKSSANLSVSQFLSSPQFCDVKLVLKISRREIQGHKIILAAASPYLYETFLMHRDSQLDLDVGGPSEEYLCPAVIKFFYGEELKISEDDIVPLFMLAVILKVKDLSQAVWEFTNELLKEEPAKSAKLLRQLARLSRTKALATRGREHDIVALCIDVFSESCESPAIQEVSKSYLAKKLLSSPERFLQIIDELEGETDISTAPFSKHVLRSMPSGSYLRAGAATPPAHFPLFSLDNDPLNGTVSPLPRILSDVTSDDESATEYTEEDRQLMEDFYRHVGVSPSAAIAIPKHRPSEFDFCI